MTRHVRGLLALGAALLTPSLALAQTSIPPGTRCRPAGAAAEQWWASYGVTHEGNLDVYLGQAADCTGFRLTALAGTPPCKVLGTTCPAGTDPSYATTQQLSAVAASVPFASTATPPAATATGTAGTAGTYLPANAAPPSLTRARRVTTDGNGNVSVTWSVPLSSSAPTGNIVPIDPGSTPVSCKATAITAQALTGYCWRVPTTTVAGITVLGTAQPATGVDVSVFACEPAP